AAEMALIRLCYAADLPGPEEALKALRDGAPLGGGPGAPAPSGGGGGGGGAATAQARMTAPAPQPQAAPTLASFEDVVSLIQARRDVGLLMDVQRFVRPISFRPGAIEFEPAPHCPPDLTR